MYLSQKDHERLNLFLAAELARRRRARGLKLTYPEAYAIIADEISEGARDGKSVAQLMTEGAQILSEDDVLPGVSALMETIMVEAMFDDGQKLICVHDPIQTAGLVESAHQPGCISFGSGEVTINGDQEPLDLIVRNSGDRPIQVGSHYHFFEVNKSLIFDREKSYGRRLAIPAGTSVRFEPGDELTVSLIEFGGSRVLYGPGGLTAGRLDLPATKAAALKAGADMGYLNDAAE